MLPSGRNKISITRGRHKNLGKKLNYLFHIKIHYISNYTDLFKHTLSIIFHILMFSRMLAFPGKVIRVSILRSYLDTHPQLEEPHLPCPVFSFVNTYSMK